MGKDKSLILLLNFGEEKCLEGSLFWKASGHPSCTWDGFRRTTIPRTQGLDFEMCSCVGAPVFWLNTYFQHLSTKQAFQNNASRGMM